MPTERFRSRWRALIRVAADDPETERRGSTAVGAMALSLVAFLIGAVVFWPLEESHATSLVLLACGVLVVPLILQCRAGHVDAAVYAYVLVLWLAVAGQPLLTRDMSTNPILVPAMGMLIVVIMPRDRIWLVAVWLATALAALLLGTTDAATVHLPREVWLATAGLVAVAAVGIIVFAADRLTLSWDRESEVDNEIARHLELVRQLQEDVNTDPLTGLANRRAMSPLLNATVWSLDEGGPAVAILDVDRFKTINDEHSHLTGDRVLARIGELLLSGSRTTDQAFRLGGDEFLVICRSGGAEALRAWLIRLQQQVRAAGAEFDARITLSAGLVAADGLTLAAAVDRADAALRIAKQEGRDAVVMA